jgi:hypothetical protein
LSSSRDPEQLDHGVREEVDVGPSSHAGDTVEGLDEGSSGFAREIPQERKPKSSVFMEQKDTLETHPNKKIEVKKGKKPKLDYSSDIIGMVIMFDPTSELLHSLNEPESIKRTKLKKLQETQVYVGSLLGKDPDDNTPRTVFDIDFTPVASEIKVPAPPADDTAQACQAENNSQQRNVATLEGPWDDTMLCDVESDFAQSSVFLDPKVDNSFEIIGEDSISYTSNDESSSKCTDCRSNFTQLPNEWFLPQELDEDVLAEKSIFADEDTLSNFAPPYEWFYPNHVDEEARKEKATCNLPCQWFHPDHVDVEPRKEKATHNLLKLLMSSSPATPVTAASSHANSFDCNEPLDTSADDFLDVMSVGSGASEVVQNLLELCRA